MTETPLTADELDDVRDYHREHGSCYQCNTGLTCVTQRWLATIAALRTQLEQAQEEGVKSVLRIRCMEHREVPAYNANEASGAECAACAVKQAGEREEAER